MLSNGFCVNVMMLIAMTVVVNSQWSSKVRCPYIGTRIHLKRTYISRLFLAQHYNKEVETLELSRCHIETIIKDAFKELTNLQELYLDNNFIEELKSYTFRGLTGVTILDLQNNRIETLPDGVFANMPNLEYINLSNNRLTHIDYGVFSTLARANLNTFCLHNNFLKELPGDITKITSNTREMSLGNNYFHCNCEMQFIKLAYTSITSKRLNCSDGHLSTYSFRCSSLFDTGYLYNVSSIRAVPMDCIEPSTPEITLELSDDELKIHCKAYGDPAPVLTIVPPDGAENDIPQHGNTTYNGNVFCTMANFNFSHHPIADGKYTCKAKNVAGTAKRSFIPWPPTATEVTPTEKIIPNIDGESTSIITVILLSSIMSFLAVALIITLFYFCKTRSHVCMANKRRDPDAAKLNDGGDINGTVPAQLEEAKTICVNLDRTCITYTNAEKTYREESIDMKYLELCALDDDKKFRFDSERGLCSGDEDYVEMI